MAPPPRSYDLPHSFPAAILRGFLGKCPRCGEGRLFRAWLKPKDHCPCCALDLREQRSDDFPAYVAIFITGHVLAPILIMLVLDFELSILALTIIVFASSAFFDTSPRASTQLLYLSRYTKPTVSPSTPLENSS